MGTSEIRPGSDSGGREFGEVPNRRGGPPPAEPMPPRSTETSPGSSAEPMPPRIRPDSRRVREPSNQGGLENYSAERENLNRAIAHLIDSVQQSPFGARQISEEIIAQISDTARSLGSSGTPVLEAIARLRENRDGEVALSPGGAAALLSAFNSVVDVAVKNSAQLELLQRRIEAHDGLIRYLFVNQEAILRSQSTGERAVDLGGTTVATAGATAIAANAFGEPIAEEVATTLLETAFGGGFVLLVRAGIEFIRATSDSAANSRQAEAPRMTVQDHLDAIRRYEERRAAQDRLDELGHSHQTQQWLSGAEQDQRGSGDDDARGR